MFYIVGFIKCMKSKSIVSVVYQKMTRVFSTAGHQYYQNWYQLLLLQHWECLREEKITDSKYNEKRGNYNKEEEFN